MPRFFSRLGEVVKWYPKDMTREERTLLSKIDWLVLSYACLAFFTKYLDVSALTNAYVSGMKDDLNLYGNRLNYINAAYEVGYVVFQIPSNLIITKLPAQYYLPAAEILWGLFTLGTAFVKTYNQLVVMRFFVGLCATSCYVGLVHIINSWYRKHELARRNALFWISNPLGQMFAGYFQAAAYTNLNNHGGLAGWRWLFIICTIITIPTAFIGFIFFPDVPERTKSRWLTESEKILARKRIEAEGFRPSRGINKTIFRRLLLNWRFWSFFSILVVFCNMVYASGTPFLLWLASQPDKYSVPLVNNIGTITNAVAIVSALSTSYYTDLRGKRWEPIVLTGALCTFGNLVLAIWDIPEGLKFFAYISVGWAQGCVPVIIAWTADCLADDLEVRALTLAFYNTFGEITALVVPLVAWQVSHAPAFRGGFIWATVLSVLFLVNTAQIYWFQKRTLESSSVASEGIVEELDTAKDYSNGRNDPERLGGGDAEIIPVDIAPKM